MAWLINLTALVIDLMPSAVLGTAFGVIAAGGILMNWGVGQLLVHGSYTQAFFVMAGVHLVAIRLIWHLRRPSATPAV